MIVCRAHGSAYVCPVGCAPDLQADSHRPSELESGLQTSERKWRDFTDDTVLSWLLQTVVSQFPY